MSGFVRADELLEKEKQAEELVLNLGRTLDACTHSCERECLQPVVNPASLIHFRNGNDLLLLIDEEEDSIISNSQAESVLFTFDLPWLGGERIFETKYLFADSFSIVLRDSAEEFLHISMNLYSIHRSSASMNSEKSPFFIISLCFLISSSSSGVNVESISSSIASSMCSIFLLISLSSLRRSTRETVSCIFENLLIEVDKGYCSGDTVEEVAQKLEDFDLPAKVFVCVCTQFCERGFGKFADLRGKKISYELIKTSNFPEKEFYKFKRFIKEKLLSTAYQAYPNVYHCAIFCLSSLSDNKIAWCISKCKDARCISECKNYFFDSESSLKRSLIRNLITSELFSRPKYSLIFMNFSFSSPSSSRRICILSFLTMSWCFFLQHLNLICPILLFCAKLCEKVKYFNCNGGNV